MKFSFEKNSQDESKPEENTELTQERFDREIITEAEMLGTNVEKLKAEIDLLGGVDKFKEYYEKGFVFNGDLSKTILNRAGDHLNDLSYKARSESSSAKNVAKVAAICYGISALIFTLGINEEGSPQVAHDAMAGLMFIIGSIGVILSIKDKMKAREIEKKKQKEELKFKMTGVEPIDRR